MIGRIKYIVLAAALASMSACSGGPSPAPAVFGGRLADGRHSAFQATVNLESAPATTGPGRNVADVRVSFSGNMEPFDIAVVNGVCTVCSVTMNVPFGTARFTFDTLDADGDPLSHTSIPSAALLGGTAIDVSLASSVGGVGIASDDDRPAFGNRAVTTLYVWARDRSNAFIIGPGAYSPPIELTQSAQPDGMHLSKTKMNGPGDSPPKIAYPGGFQSASVTARSGRSSATMLVAPRVPVTSVSLPSTPQALLGAAGNYVWTYFWAPTGSSIGRLDVVSGTKRITPLSIKTWDPGAFTAATDGSLWYAGCQNRGSIDAKTGVGHVTAGGAADFFASDAMLAFTCPNLAIAPDGSIWFTGGSDLTTMSPAGAFATVAVKPRPNASTQLSSIAFLKDRTMWMIGGSANEVGSLVHVSPSGAVLGRYGGRKFVSLATDGRDRIYAIGWTAISVFDSSGTLQSKDALATSRSAARTVTPDGSLWFAVGADEDLGYVIVARIARSGSMWEFSVPSDGNYIPALAATGDGSVWFPYSYSAKLSKIKL